MLLVQMVSNAQHVKGDMNNDGQVTIGDITASVRTALGNTPLEYVGCNPYVVDNSQITGDWYVLADKMFTFNADGTTNYSTGHYKFYPMLGRIVFCTESDIPVTALDVYSLSESTLSVAAIGDNDITTYYKTPQSSSGALAGHEYIDLGLSVKWATCNLGANAPEEYGKYYAWGETYNKSTYNSSTYKWSNGTSTSLTKYIVDSKFGKIDNNTELDPEDDAATVNWGGEWRMPTETEMQELIDNCIWKYTNYKGVEGCMVISKVNGNYIFLPAAGIYADTGWIMDEGVICGHYWTSTLRTDYSSAAKACAFDIDETHEIKKLITGSSYRIRGCSIRPVRP